MNVVAPSPAARRIEATHCTGEWTCFSSNVTKSFEFACTCASTFAITGYRSGVNGVARIASASFGATAYIAGEWNAPETFNALTRFAPAALSASVARGIAASGPVMTT